MPKSAVGLDISSRRLLAVEIQNPGGKRPVLVKSASVELPEGAARDSEVVDIVAVSAALKQLWQRGKFGSKRVVLGVGNQRVLVRDHTVEEMPAAQLSQSLPYQVADLLPVPVSETILDFYPIEPVADSAPPQMRGLLVAALKTSVETTVATLEDAGLKVVGVDLSSFAMLRALGSGEALSGTRTVVTVGPRTTQLVVAREGVPQFVRLVPVGGENITDALVDATGLDRGKAEELKNGIGVLHGDDPRFAEASTAILEALRGIVSAIRSTNSYYQGNYSAEPIAGVVLLGADTRLPGFPEVVTESIGLPAVLGDPLSVVRVRGPVVAKALEAVAADLAIPVGLALGSR